ncbi:hypothetical protein N1851_034390 [Merluccius polli]|uniref:Gag-pol polyprotein n=2 Tax=Merluccius polli TaxID=89951 RepID=A0AA47LZQ1_MERPO|nr:hypothetical protein N1851_034390 [Merluccius polli]
MSEPHEEVDSLQEGIQALGQVVENTEELLRSSRSRNPTAKMLEFQKNEAQKKEKKLACLYDQWKMQARKARNELKSDIPESQIASLVDAIERARDNVLSIYSDIRDCVTPSTETRRRIDACEAVSRDILKIAFERISGINGDFEFEEESQRLHGLLHLDYAVSVFGSSASHSSRSSQHSRSSTVAAKRADAAADLAAKEAEYELLLKEKRQKERIQHLEEQQRTQLEAQKRELEQIKAEKELRAARARLQAYEQEAAKEYRTQSVVGDTTSQNYMLPHDTPSPLNVTAPPYRPPHTDVSLLAQAVQDSIAVNRLPTPEPSVFNGNPIHFIEWKASFISLIDQRNIPAADKLYYLKKYVTGAARRTLDGVFYRNDDEAYQDAWNKLNHRYGQPFVIQRAFRDKLASWPKLQAKDSEGLRNFSDFLNACQEAIPHVMGLQILNDCEENQKLVQKLPDWLASRWNRQVTKTLNDHKEFPSFQDFTVFMSLEADVACNPITSFHALHSPDVSREKRNQRDMKRNKASVLNTQTVTHSESPKLTKESTKPQCMFCQSNNHQLYSCSEFMTRSLEERRQYVKEKRLCYGCMKNGHNAKDCRHRHSCDTCKGKHPTCLHDENYVKKGKLVSQVMSTSGNTNESTTALSLNVARKGPGANTSMIVPVWVSSSKNPRAEKLVYAMLDTQSDTAFIDQEVSHTLHADEVPVKLKLTTMIGKDTVVESQKVSGLRVRGHNSTVLIDLPHVYTKDCIPVNRAHIPTCETARKWAHLNMLADEILPLQDCEVGLLIGYNCSRALAPRQVILGEDEEPYAVRTDLGWSIVGPSSSYHDSPSTTSLCHRVTVKEQPPVTPADALRVLESDFKDSNEDGKTASQDDILFLNKLKQGIKTTCNGHYEMPLPFKERPYLPNNKHCAVVRLNHLKRKLSKDERYKEQYTEFMAGVIGKGDAEEVNDDGIEGEKWYIPHHGVFHPRKPGKLRVVFDCSAKCNGTSLNDHLLSGPDLTNNLTGVLLRFRQHPVALMCDIEKMFHQFRVYESDREYLRFLWWKDGDLSAQPKEYHMNVHLFGAASSPGCANYGLQHLAKEYQHIYPLGSQFIMRNFYVDDGITSVDKANSAIQLVQEARELCAKGGLRLHKFISNDMTVMENIPPSERATNVKDLNLTFDDSPLERTLGIQWRIDTDCFSFSINLKDQPATRRGVLSTVASLYDPLGLVAPFLLIGKGVLQEMCRSGTGWDDPIPTKLQPRWEQWKDDLINLEKISIKRCYAPPGFGKIIKTELHHYSDASTSGYGQCSYIRVKNEAEDIHCALIPELSVGDPEVRKAQALHTEITEQISFVDRLSNFSSWLSVIRAVARIQRRINNDKSSGHSTVLEREKAECFIIKALQSHVYKDDLTLLNKGTKLQTHKELYKLDAFVDKDGVLKVGGRLCDSSLPNSLKHPAIIPKDHHITKLIIAHCHEKVKHQGKGLTINEIRSNGYWIPGMNRAVASYIWQCVTCRRLRRSTEIQRMADLPPERVEPSPPFTYSGMDCFGPFFTKQGRKEHKRYGLLFTCFCSRAIHIEMLDDLSTDSFINGLRCFIAIRGAVRQIKSDQGTNFVGAKNAFNEALKELDTNRLTAFLAEKQCDFSMNAPHSSHVGGVWERQIRTVRSILSSTISLSSGRLDDASLRTFLYEAMAIVNSRPLTVDNLNDPKSLEPLTPNHLLTMKSVNALPPPGKFIREDMYARKRWRHIQYLAEQFWSRWRKEYLSNISVRQRWHCPKRNLKVDDIVLEKSDDLPRNEWRLCRVTEATVGKDGLVRKVKLSVGDRNLTKRGERCNKVTVIERPVQKLVLLLEAS